MNLGLAAFVAFVFLVMVVLAVGAGILFRDSYQHDFDLAAANEIENALLLEMDALKNEKALLEGRVSELEGTIQQRDAMISGYEESLETCTYERDMANQSAADQRHRNVMLESQLETQIAARDGAAYVPQTSKPAQEDKLRAAPVLAASTQFDLFSGWTPYLILAAVLFAISTLFTKLLKGSSNIHVAMTRDDARAFAQWKRQRRD